MVAVDCHAIHTLSEYIVFGYRNDIERFPSNLVYRRCVYEVLSGPQPAAVQVDKVVFLQQRSKPPWHRSVAEFLFSERMMSILQVFLVPNAYLFNEECIVKCSNMPASVFPWHRDSDGCRQLAADYHAYISVWCALDDTTESNGCLHVWPGSHHLQPGKPDMQPNNSQVTDSRCKRSAADVVHNLTDHEAQSNVNYAVLPLAVAAGSAIILADTLWHCSGPNTTRHYRRAWMSQFSAGPILRSVVQAQASPEWEGGCSSDKYGSATVSDETRRQHNNCAGRKVPVALAVPIG